MDDLAITVDSLGKKYRLGANAQSYKTLRESLMGAFGTPLRALSRLGHPPDVGEPGYRPDFWALKDVSFEVKRGEALGVIGHNGAGKSTLLKLLSQITEPTEGEIRLKGRVASLLEVGTGFHPELTGRENIYLNGAILGMARVDITHKFREIVEFAEIEQFIDTPVKRYSSGMYLRLAFAVAAHLEPEILVVDEVLAVGDAAFQKKCLGKMEDVSHTGRTVLFVSHNMAAIEKLCQRCIMLHKGSLGDDGPPERVVSAYLDQHRISLAAHYMVQDAQVLACVDRACLVEAQVLNVAGDPCSALRFGEPFALRMVWQHRAAIPGVTYAIRVFDARGTLVFATNTLQAELRIESPGRHCVTCGYADNVLVPGDYVVTIGCYIRPHTVVHVVDPCLRVEVLDAPYSAEFAFDVVGGPAVAVRSSWAQVL